MNYINTYDEHITTTLKEGSYVLLNENNWNVPLASPYGKIIDIIQVSNNQYFRTPDSYRTYKIEAILTNGPTVLTGGNNAIIRLLTPEEIEEFNSIMSANKFNI